MVVANKRCQVYLYVMYQLMIYTWIATLLTGLAALSRCNFLFTRIPRLSEPDAEERYCFLYWPRDSEISHCASSARISAPLLAAGKPR